MEPDWDAQFDAASARGRALMQDVVRAQSARYDQHSGRIEVALTNGCLYAFPTLLIEDLSSAGPTELAEVRVDGQGLNLHWPKLGADISVPALVAGIFGTKAWMNSEFARRAGQSRSMAKASASRQNGARGGRPRKSPVAV